MQEIVQVVQMVQNITHLDDDFCFFFKIIPILEGVVGHNAPGIYTNIF